MVFNCSVPADAIQDALPFIDEVAFQLCPKRSIIVRPLPAVWDLKDEPSPFAERDNLMKKTRLRPTHADTCHRLISLIPISKQNGGLGTRQYMLLYLLPLRFYDKTITNEAEK